jgi:predicted nucleotidyltransferase
VGTELKDHATAAYALAANAPWLDNDTAALMEDIIVAVARARPDLLAAILYGSVARHEERPLNVPYPSDVDLLFVFDTDDEYFTANQGHDVIHVLGLSRNRHLDAPREVQVLFSSRGIHEWDPTFVANVARDGKVLFSRRDASEPAHSLLDLYGLGKHLWDGIDAQTYVERERDSWDG